MNQTFSEKEILADALTSEKGATNNFNIFANECINKDLRNTVLQVLNQEHSIQQDVFNIMHEKGYYPVSDADERKISEAKQRFQGSASNMR
jgi:spore coat protein CotF